jgi:hypothetical protein
MSLDSVRSETNATHAYRGLARVLLLFVVIVVAVVSRSAAAPVRRDQQGVTKTTCRADSVYIYKYATTHSERRGRMGRGASFRVYHYVDGTWAFGVHNSSGVSGYVLREKLCD